MPIRTSIKYLLLSPVLYFYIYFYLHSTNKTVIDEDINSWIKIRPYIRSKRGGWKTLIRLIVEYPAFRAQFYLRIGNKKAKWLKHLFKPINSCELPYESERIGGGLVMPHGYLIVLNPCVIIGNNCTILQGVTIGATDKGVPTIGDNCYIGCNAVIIGKVHIGNNVKIGAGTVVVKDIPDNATVVGSKNRVIIKEQYQTII